MRKEEQRLHKEIAELLAEVKSADEAEDAFHGPDKRGDELPEALSHRESRLARKLRTKKGRETHARRKEMIEPVFGQIKQARGFRQFLLRGMEKMRGKWRLVCMTHNLLKLFRSQQVVTA